MFNNMKNKLFSSIFLIGLLIISILIFLPHEVNAQGILPIGGDSFETAVSLSLGEYQGGTLEDGQEWFYSVDRNIQPGQEIQAQVLFTGNTLMSTTIYNQDKQRLTKAEMQKGDKLNTTYWLNGSSESGKYYLRLSNDAIWSATLKNVNIKVVDRFDANSQTDAGGSFENALPVEAGQYKGFLDFNYNASDEQDFYKINVFRGQKLTVRVTPPEDLYIALKIYDKNRSELVNEYSENKGAIVTGSIQVLASDIFYIAVAPQYGSDQDQASQYTLEISGATPDTQKSGVANLQEKANGKPLAGNPLSPIGSSILGGIGKSIKFILLIAATVLIIIVVTVILLLKGESGKKESAKVKTTEFIYCSKCGAQNPSGAKFCSKCGEQLK